ncbi:MAG: DNA translocase FtsK [Lachnospiraceae bacterium]|nr:DNA translocase FtsK [Lachnospiraceae bacterium]
MAKTKKKNKKKDNKEIKIILTAAIAILLELCVLNVLGKAGGWVGYALFGLFGLMAYAFPILGAAAFIYYFLRKEKLVSKLVCGAIFFICLAAFFHLITYKVFLNEKILAYFTTCARNHTGGGIIGGILAFGLAKAVGIAGAYIITILAMIVCLLFICEVPVLDGIRSLIQKIRDRRNEDDYDREDDEVPDKVIISNTRFNSRARKKKSPEPYYETVSDEGVTIRIVPSSGQRRPKPQLTRSANKATPLRNGSVQPKRSNAKAKGIVNVEILQQVADGDEVHEITNAQPAKPEVTVEVPAKTIQVTELTEADLPIIQTEAPEAIMVSKEQKAKTERAERKPDSKVTMATEIVPKKPKEKKETETPAKQPKPATAVRSQKGDGYVFPPIDLLSRGKGRGSGISQTELNKMAANLEMVLNQYGAYAKVIDMQAGPSVTRFELQPEMGVRVNKFTSLADDLKLNLAVPDVRIEAPIPGRAAIGIEIPNQSTQKVLMRDLLEDETLMKHPSKIAMAAGIDISGNVVTADIDAMPHLLIGGTTGSGKSVFTKSLIMTILFRAKPSEVGLIIVDPKKVEFNAFNGIPHMMKEVVTDPGQAVSTLRWVVNEMDNRYMRMQMSGVNDIKSYNNKFDRGLISEDETNPKRMQQIVIVIDELSDLMLTAAKEVESLIIRLAQLARAAGIHLIIATQRPSANVITGLIKANIPSKVALRVTTSLESRIILDMKGAEELLGHGDMLFHPNGMVKPIRVQGALVTEKEVNDVVKFLKSHNSSDYYEEENQQIQDYMNNTQSTSGGTGSEDAGNADKMDEYLYEAGLLCIEMGKASSSMLQRRFSIGFNRAARIIDQLTEMGAIGPANGAKPREILVDSYTFEEMFQMAEEE